MNLPRQAVIVPQQGIGAEMCVIGRQDHDGIGAGVQALAGKTHNLVCHHIAGVDNQFYPVIYLPDSKARQLPALVHGHGEKLAGAALYQDAVHAVFHQILKQFRLVLQVQGSILVKERNGWSQI